MERRRFIKTLGASAALLKTQLAWPQSSPNPIVLAEGGQSTYSIYLSQDASPSEEHGAQELQRFLQEISGARLPILSGVRQPAGNLVLVGQSDRVGQLEMNIPFQSLGAEGYALKTSGNHLVIAGGRQRGTMYGVYGLLEKLGCRWFTPEVSRIPKMPAVTLAPLDEIGRPSFEYRYPFFTECMDRDWAARNRMNGMPALDESTGGKVEYYPFVHTFYLLIPPQRYFKEHPEYFALVDGKRRAERAQLCLTNPNVLRISIATVLGWIRDHPEATLFSVSQNDSQGWCECVHCQQVEQEEGGAHSGPILRFVNAIAAVVAKKYPDKLIDTLAYQYSQSPPAKIRPLPNVRIRLCPISACQAHPYATCRYDAYIMKDLRGWARITGPQLYVWHYVTNFSHTLRPFPDLDELAADIPMYQRHGVVGLFMEGFVAKGGGAADAELKSYLMARLLWDTHADAQLTMNEFLAAYYGNAAPALRKYHDLLEGMVRFPPAGKGQHLWCCGSPHFSGEFLSRAQELFHQAESAAEKEAVKRRIQKTKLSIDYLELVRAKQFTLQNGWYRPANLTRLKDQYGAFMNQVRDFGITTLRERGSLERDEQEFAKLTKPYRVVSLESASLLLHIVPELSGRIIQITDKRAGTDVLLSPDPSALTYPDVRGLAAFVSPDSHAQHLWEVQWKVESHPKSGSLLLSGSSANGLQLSRKIELRKREPWIHTETVVQNTATATLSFALELQLEANPGGETPEVMDHVWVNFSQPNGAVVNLKLIEPEEEPAGRKIYTGTARPNGEWRIVNRHTGLILTHRFPPSQVERCELRWSTKNWSVTNPNWVSFIVWTEEQSLGQGQSFKFDADYGVEFESRRGG